MYKYRSNQYVEAIQIFYDDVTLQEITKKFKDKVYIYLDKDKNIAIKLTEVRDDLEYEISTRKHANLSIVDNDNCMAVDHDIKGKIVDYDRFLVEYKGGCFDYIVKLNTTVGERYIIMNKCDFEAKYSSNITVF